jgi:hypothetical protein
MKQYLVALAVAAPFVLIGCSVPTDSGSEPGATKSSANAPVPVKVGVAFTIGKHTMGKGWKLAHQEYLGSKVTGTVTNVSSKTSTAFFHIKFLKGSAVVGNMQCTSSDLEPKQSQAIECLNMVQGDTNLLKKGAYTTVTAETDAAIG